MAILDSPLVIARQAQKLTLMDALVFATIGRTRNWGTSAEFRAVRVRAPANRPGECGTFTARSRTAASARRGSFYGRGYQSAERRPQSVGMASAPGRRTE